MYHFRINKPEHANRDKNMKRTDDTTSPSKYTKATTTTPYTTTSPPTTSQPSTIKFLHHKLPRNERIIYWIIWLTSITFPFYTAWKTSKKYHPFIKHELQPSWLLNVGLMKDPNDYEWDYWWSNAGQLALLFTANTVITLFIRRFVHLDYQHFVLLCGTLVLQGIALSIQGLCMVILFIGVMYLIISYQTKPNATTVWIISIITLWVIHHETLRPRLMILFGVVGDDYSGLVQLVFMMAILRIISFANIYNNNKAKNHYNQDGNNELKFQHLLMYTLYIPVCYNGPVISFDTFYQDFYKTPKDFPIKEVLKDTVKTAFNVFALEIFYHFVYANTLCKYHDILREMSVIEAISMFWIHLHIFNIKYFIFYRFSGIFAKVDGIKPPGPPKCIASLYTFVDMWRYFDKGLNTFLIQNIYIPLGGSMKGFLRQASASFSCFAFVGYWHGADKSLMAWALTNWLGIVVESIGTRIVKMSLYKDTVRHISPLLHRRLCALGGAFSVFALIYTNMIFLVGLDPATILLWRIFSIWYWPLLCLLVFYCGNNCSIDASYT